ncbi:MAG: LacI family DNA-binding transcriptional regulator [Planctomycetota bacterium]
MSSVSSASSPQRVTLTHVAEHVGLAKTTVSDILNRGGAARYSVDTCRRVHQAVQDLGYAPSRAAQQLARGRTAVVGLMLTRDFTNPYWARLANAAQELLRAQGMSMRLEVCRAEDTDDLDRMRQFKSDGVEGLIVGPVYETKDMQQHQAYFQGMLPTVIFGAELEGYDAVADAHVASGRLAIAHLKELGHRRIGYLCAPDADLDQASVSRYAGMRTEIQSDPHGGEVDQRWVLREPDVGDFMQYRAVAAAFARQWLDTPVEQRPTAMLCHNDQVAMASIAALTQAGIRVPDDVSLIGFDNLPECEAVHPAITSIDGHIDQQMQRAIDLLLNRIKRPGKPSTYFSPPPTLVGRQSVCDLSVPST